MIEVGTSSTTPEPDQAAVPEKSKERIPLMAIPVTLAIGLLVGAIYVGNRIFASGAHATAIVTQKPDPIVKPVAQFAERSPAEAAQVQTSEGQPAPAFSAKPLALSLVQREVGTAAQAGTSAQPGIVVTGQQPTTTGESPATKPEGREANSGDSETRDLGLIAPQHGERYLQIAAISTNMVPSFLADLKKYDVQASVAPGPHDGLVRIVIGPFADRESVGRAKDQIQAKWADCFVRLY